MTDLFDPAELAARKLARMQNPTLAVDVACNDPDNGMFAGRAEIVQVGDALELTCQRVRPPTFIAPDLSDSRLKFGRRRYETVGSKDWFGNWCWNRYVLPFDEAIRLLCDIHDAGTFSVDSGWADLCDAWTAPGPMSTAVLRAHLCEMAVESVDSIRGNCQ